MKRTSAIFTSIFLSILIICMGGGIGIVQCMHTQAIRISQISDFQENHCEKSSSCMKFSIEKLDPSLRAQVSTQDFSAIQPLLCIFHPIFSYWLQQQTKEHETQFCQEDIPIPPRLYLSLNCTLLI